MTDKGIFLAQGRQKQHQSSPLFYNNKHRESTVNYDVQKLRKNFSKDGLNTLPRVLKFRLEGETITHIGILHPEKPQKSFEFMVTEVIEVVAAERKLKILVKDREALRLLISIDTEYEEICKYLQQSKLISNFLPCVRKSDRPKRMRNITVESDTRRNIVSTAFRASDSWRSASADASSFQQKLFNFFFHFIGIFFLIFFLKTLSTN